MIKSMCVGLVMVSSLVHAECPVADIQRVYEGAYSCESWVTRFGPDRLITEECLDLNRNAGLFRYFWYEQPSCAPYRKQIDYIWKERNVVAKAVDNYYRNKKPSQ